MTDSADEPDWKLLPDNPLGFFGFTAAFDQKDLKRRYNQFIKRFKPEKFPEEFQRIRAAYEALEHRLRYQMFYDPPAYEVRHETVDDEPSTPVSTSKPSSPVVSSDGQYEIVFQEQSPPVLTLLDRVRQTDPDALLAELRAKSQRTQEEQLLLTFLQDASQPTGTEFLDGLLYAVQQHRDEDSWELLRNYLQSDEAKARCQEYLERIFFVLASDDVYSLTEPLWDALQTRVRFPVFLETLNNCARHVQDHRHIGRVMFDIRLTRRLAFYAPLDWITQQLTRLSSGDIVWPDWLDAQIYHLQHLIEYLKFRRRFLNGIAIRTQIDDLLQAYCVDAPDFDQRFLNFQNQLLSDFPSLAAAFPRSDATGSSVWNAWNYVCDQVGHRFASGTLESDSRQRANQQMPALTKTLQRASFPMLRSPRHWTWWVWLIAMVLLVGLPVGQYFLIVPQPGTPDGPVVRCGVGLVLGIILYSLIGVSDIAAESWFTWAFYNMGMRRELASFLRRFPLPANLFYFQLRSLDLGSARAHHQLAQIDRDLALRFYATAAWFLR